MVKVNKCVVCNIRSVVPSNWKEDFEKDKCLTCIIFINMLRSISELGKKKKIDIRIALDKMKK